MSTNLAYSGPLSRAADRFREYQGFEDDEAPRRVRIVTTRAQRKARPKVVYAIVAIAMIFAIFLAQLLLSIALSGGAYRISTLQAEQVQDGRVASALNEKLNTLGSTQNLAANARSLGMVLSASQAFLRLSDGAVLGKSTEAPASTSPVKPAATSSVPNSLLTNVPLVKLATSGHGGSNAADLSSGGTQSSSDSATTGSSSTSTTSTTTPPSNALPSPQN